MDRQAVVAGQFYSDDSARLKSELGQLIRTLPDNKGAVDKLVMVPHAGYVFSGAACGQVFSKAHLGETVIMLGPNHTGTGNNISVWPGRGSWIFPGGRLDIDEETAGKLVDSSSGFSFDETAHLREHSLEVVIPFLHFINPAARIVPVCVSESDLESLETAGKALAKIVSESSSSVSILVSSDMSHYISADLAKKKDSMALEKVVRVDPYGLYSVVSSNRISMCGVLPMTMALFAARRLGAMSGKLVSYTNSGNVTGDMDQVVAYAGVIVS